MYLKGVSSESLALFMTAYTRMTPPKTMPERTTKVEVEAGVIARLLHNKPEPTAPTEDRSS